jgi:excisionase family DNA binding protein
MSNFNVRGPGFTIELREGLIEIDMTSTFTDSAQARTAAAALTAAAAALEAYAGTQPAPRAEPVVVRLPGDPDPLNYRYWFTTRQAAEHTGVSPTTIVRACASGELKASQRSFGSNSRIARADLDEWAGRGRN